MSENETHTLSDLKIDPKLKNKKEMSKTKIIFIILILAAISFLVFAKFSKVKPVKIKTFTVLENNNQSNTSILSASGYITPRRRATVSSKITGKVKEMLVEEGMKVKEGQVLAKLDDSNIKEQFNMANAGLNEAQASYNQTTIELKNSEKEFYRTKSLFEKGMASQQELDNVKTTFDSLKAGLKVTKAKIESAKANIKYYKQELENYIVKSPFAGIAVSKDAEVGEMVSPVSAGGGYTRTGISTIVDMNSLEIEVDVNESYIARVVAGQKVKAELDAYQGFEYIAKVRTIIPTADRQKATVKVRISFDQLDEKILPDMGVKVSFLSTEIEKENSPKILIPKNSTFKENNNTYVFIVEENKVEKRAISTGSVFENNISVTSGLTSGDKIAVTNLDKLTDKSEIIIE